MAVCVFTPSQSKEIIMILFRHVSKKVLRENGKFWKSCNFGKFWQSCDFPFLLCIVFYNTSNIVSFAIIIMIVTTHVMVLIVILLLLWLLLLLLLLLLLMLMLVVLVLVLVLWYTRRYPHVLAHSHVRVETRNVRPFRMKNRTSCQANQLHLTVFWESLETTRNLKICSPSS